MVTITVNGQTMKRILHVERVSEIREDNLGPDEEDGDP
jgi:hypothetical protein